MKRKKRLTKSEYAQSLKDRYGEDFLKDFDKVLAGTMTLADIADKHNISATYAGGIFKRLNGEKSYTDFKKRGWVRDHRGRKVEYNPKGPSKSLIVTLPNDIHHRLRKYSLEVNVSMSSVIRDAIVAHLDKKIIRKFFPSSRK